MDCKVVEEKIVRFIRKKVEDAGATGVVLGLSGGIDSSLTAFLCAKALGKEKVLALLMPDTGGEQVAKLLGVDYENINLDNVAGAAQNACKFADAGRVPAGNLKARLRMALLYYHANVMKRLVAGTSNKTEILTGYFTKYGDGASDFIPLGGLYKTQVRELARFVKLPEKIITATPTAGLWEGQTDEGELGIDYETLDRVLELFEKNRNVAQATEELKVLQEKVIAVWQRVRNNAHKREMPQVCIV